MCGIAGFLGSVGNPERARDLLEEMLNSVQHRGPDGRGVYINEAIGLGHVRLSIVDLANGNQPMANEDETLWVVFNGEIFNYLELRDELIKRGHKFRTQSDTEVILHLYEERGPSCVEAFNGDFAFALWDHRNRRLLLARDRMGVRPLYYTQLNGVLFFGSEIKALLQVPGLQAELDPIALEQCFTFWCPLAPRTVFRNVEELPPGHSLVVERGRQSLTRYWKWQFPDVEEAGTLVEKEEDALEELKQILLDATRIRLRADVPVGAYLSGGLDSSAIAALVRYYTPHQLHTFSIGFEERALDESRHQQALAEALATQHEAIVCTRSSIAADFPRVIYHTERPTLRSAPVPMFHLAQHVRRNAFKVVLTGEGADEVLAGYDIFKEAKVRRYWGRQPASARRPKLLQRLYPYLPGLHSQPQSYLEAFFRTGLDRLQDPLFSHLPRWAMTSRIKDCFSADFRQSVACFDVLEDLRAKLPPEMGRWHPLSQAQYLEATILLPGYILSSQGDRVAMAHGIEGRFPFLDHRLVEFSARLAPRLKIKVLREKYLLRQSMRALLPPLIAARPKQPYRAPDSQCFLAATPPDYVQTLLSREAITQSGYFDPTAVEKLIQKCRKQPVIGNRDDMALLGVLSVQLLDHMYVRRVAPGPPPSPIR